MKRFAAVALGATVLAALAGPRGPLGAFWTPAPDTPHAHGALLAGFVAEGLVEALAFGLGLAVLLLARPWFTVRLADRGRATTAWLATAWLLASWWPHAALHQHIGLDPAAVLPIEWVFHTGSIVAAVLLLWSFSSVGSVSPSAGGGRSREDAVPGS